MIVNVLSALACLQPYNMIIVNHCTADPDRIGCILGSIGAWQYVNGSLVLDEDIVVGQFIFTNSLSPVHKQMANESFYDCIAADPVFSVDFNSTGYLFGESGEII